MKFKFIHHLLKIKTAAIMFCLLFFVAGFSTFAHTVTGYITNCGTGPSYSIDATVTNVNASSNYAWQYKNTAGVWVCIVNGNNTISGNVYSISGATSTATTNPTALVFNNPNSSLNGLVIRCVISDGSGVNACTLPVNNTWNSNAASVNQTISVIGSACGTTTNCSCPGNLVTNPSFENGTYGWGSSGGNFNAGTGAIYCGAYSGDFQITNTSNNWVSQTIGTDLAVGTVINAKVYAGVHDNSFYAYVSIAFFDATWNYLGASVKVEVNKVLASTPVGPQLYNLSATVPANTKYTQVSYGANGNWIKTDNWCVTSTPPVTLGSIGNYVWNDGNGNGIQDATEVGLNGVSIQLKNSAGTVIATTTSDASGYYQFTGLAAGTYTVTFLSVAGYGTSPVNQGSDDTKDSDVINNASGNAVVTVVLTSGQSNQTIDAGFCPITLQLGNRVWNDINNNGINDGEAGIANITVHLYKDNNNDNIADGAFIATEITDASGYFNFDNLVPGNYIIGVVTPAGFVRSAVNGGDPDNDINLDNNGLVTVGNETRGLAITLAGGTEPDGVNTNTNNNITYDFGFHGAATASLGDYVWNDANGNGIQDASEVGLSGVTVQLKTTTGSIIATTTSDANGFYQFTGITPGTYIVQFVAVAGYGVSPINVGSNDTIDSDVNASGAVTVTLVAGESNQTIDAGFCPTTLCIGNLVFSDVNNNGLKDGTEVGISGLTVNIYQDSNNDNIADGLAFAATTTTAGGVYSFCNLVPGNYIIGVVKPTGYNVSSINGSDPDNNIDNDNNGIITVGTEIRGNAITVTGGLEPDGSGASNTNSNNTYDFGFVPTGSIGNFVWNDINANGVQDAGEPGIAGVIVTLTYPNATTATATTNASGNYTFSNLAPGTYSVTFATPAGYSTSPSNVVIAGATDANDSDPVGGIVTGIVLTAGQINNTVDAGFFICTLSNVGFTGPTTICAGEAALFAANPAGTGSVYTWTFMNGTPASATGSSATSTWNTPGEYDITLNVNKNGCTGSFTRSIIITQSVFANAGPDAEICSGSSTTINGTGPTGANYSWIVLSGDPTSIDNGTNQSSVLVSPLVTTTYQLTVSQNGCNRVDQITVFINVNKNPIADAGTNKTTLVGTSVVIGGSPTGTPPLATPGAALGYIWSPSTGLNSNTVSNPTVTLNTPGVYNYQVIVYSILTGCSDTATVSVTVLQPVNLGNTVFYDKNNNGIKDAGENGIFGATVKLYKDDNNDNVADGASLVSITTTTTGTYSFANLYPGNYIVGVVIPSGYAAVTTNGGDPDNNIDNDNNGSNTSIVGEVRSLAITLLAGTEPSSAVDGDDINGNQTLDFALKGTGSLGDFVWKDINRNGIQDAGEPGLPNVIVTLTYSDGTTFSTTTSAFGGYKFADLAPGDYSLNFTTPTGFLPTLSNVNTGTGTDNNDSDPVNGTVANIVIAPGDVNTSVDAGFYEIINITGNVWHDVNGLSDNLVNNSGGSSTPPAATIPVGLRAYLVNNATGLVEKVAFVSSLTNTFTFSNVSANTNYYIILSNTQALVGNPPPAASLPTGWQNTGEKLGSGTGSDGIINGRLNVPVGITNVTNANFGIKLKSGEVVIG